MRYGSVCSGIEAASVAWHPLGWRAAWFAEIEAFPSAVLAHHYPDVPNLGDMTTLPAQVRLGLIEAPDVLVGGTPCQAFSVAGLRNSLGDDRGNLTLSYFHLLDAIDHVRAERNEPACIAVWENVPGVLSTKDNAFGCFLAGLAGESEPLLAPGGKWADAGYVFGPSRTIAWRILDAQYFGLAQRRRRVFVVASARDDIDPAAILFEFEGVRRDSPPSREAREEIAPTIRAGAPNGGAGHGARSGDSKDELIVPCLVGGIDYENNGHGPDDPTGPLLKGSPSGGGHPLPAVAVWPAQVASTLNAHFGDKMGLEDQHALNGASLFVPAVTVPITARMFNALGARDVEEGAVIATRPEYQNPLPGEKSNDYWQRMLDYEAEHGISPYCLPINTQIATRGEAMGRGTGFGLGNEADPAYTLQAGHSHAVAVGFNHNAAVDGETAHPLRDGNGEGVPGVLQVMQVRRLTPTECERLQGFPDGYTLVPHRNKPAADGPRYKALGNSMAVPCMRWIGERIAMSLL